MKREPPLAMAEFLSYLRLVALYHGNDESLPCGSSLQLSGSG